jgi:hypothetical protein
MNLSSTAGAQSKTLFGFNVDQGLILRVAGGAVLGMLGFYYLLKGKQEQSMGPMFLGAVLLVASLFVFV